MPCALSAAGPAPSPPRPSQPRHTWWQGEVPPSPSFSSWPLRRAAWLVPPSRGAVCPCGASRPGLPSARARPEDGSQRIFRRAYNYDAAPGAGGISDSGLIFVSYQADVERQFTPIQRRLDEMDMLNQWTKPIGRPCSPSPPGAAKAVSSAKACSPDTARKSHAPSTGLPPCGWCVVPAGTGRAARRSESWGRGGFRLREHVSGAAFTGGKDS